MIMARESWQVFVVAGVVVFLCGLRRVGVHR